jgi:hypothetical protein
MVGGAFRYFHTDSIGQFVDILYKIVSFHAKVGRIESCDSKQSIHFFLFPSMVREFSNIIQHLSGDDFFTNNEEEQLVRQCERL